MGRSSKSNWALVAICAAATFNIGAVSAADSAEDYGSHGGPPRAVSRATKVKGGTGPGGCEGAAASQALAPGPTFEACDTHTRRAGDGLAATALSDRGAAGPGRSKRSADLDPLVNALQVLLSGMQGTPERRVSQVLCSMADSMHEGLAVCDERGTLVYVNDSLCRMLGQRREDMIGSPAADFLHGMASRFVQDSGEASFEIEWRHSPAGGALLKMAVHHFVDAEGKGVGCFAVVRDFSRRHRAEIALRRSESELRLLSAQLLAAHETERRRIARGLHDGIGQSLGGIKFGLECCMARLSAESPQTSTQNVRQLVSRIQGVIEEVRRVAMNLRPSVLDHLGIAPTIDWFCREFNAIYSQVQLEADVDVCEDEIPIQVKTAIYRIVQESCNNAVRYAEARRIAVSLKQNSGQVQLVVADDGVGFDPSKFVIVDPSGRGLGLASMRERVEATAGRFRLNSKPGQGTTVRAAWPSRCPRIDAFARCRTTA